MPLYEVSHVVSLTGSQRDELAYAITKVHTEMFKAPKVFVNVHFVDASMKAAYVGGKRSRSNLIKAHVRHGPSRTQEQYNALCKSIAKAWSKIVGAEGDQSLRTILILGDIVAGYENGFELPQPGKDKEWFEENLVAFKQKASEGDAEFAELVKDGIGG